VVDFYCACARLVIELDGSQHYEENERLKDQERDAYLHELGITVVRYTNLDIHKKFDAVCADIVRRINTSSGSLREPPSPQGEGLK
jgi:very-short-patch-repair endonuclease